MNKRNLLNFLFVPTLILAPLTAISCVDKSEKSDLNALATKIGDVVNKKENPAIEVTKKIINDLLKQVYRDNDVEKINFLDQQQNKEYQKNIFLKIKELSKKWNSKLNNTEKENIANQLNQIYEKNWYIVLTNINKFNLRFYEWLLFDKPEFLSQIRADGKHSKEYLNSLKSEKKPDNVPIINNYLRELKEGDESGELSNMNMLYLKKDSMIFRFRVVDTLTKPKIKLTCFVWYFSKFKNISINLISDIVHSAYIHGVQEGFNRFENDMANRYGKPAKMIMGIFDDNASSANGGKENE